MRIKMVINYCKKLQVVMQTPKLQNTSRILMLYLIYI